MQYDHWVAFGLLLLVGCHMCYQAILEMKSPGGPEQAAKVHGWLKILIVSAITSIDSLGVGISLGLVGKPIVLYSVVVGLGAFVSTWVGIYLARRVASRFAERMEFVGGAVLIALGIKMLSI
jgi:putative Mn2+ efflux pump MntP